MLGYQVCVLGCEVCVLGYQVCVSVGLSSVCVGCQVVSGVCVCWLSRVCVGLSGVYV